MRNHLEDLRHAKEEGRGEKKIDKYFPPPDYKSSCKISPAITREEPGHGSLFHLRVILSLLGCMEKDGNFSPLT